MPLEKSPKQKPVSLDIEPHRLLSHRAGPPALRSHIKPSDSVPIGVNLIKFEMQAGLHLLKSLDMREVVVFTVEPEFNLSCRACSFSQMNAYEF